MSKQNQQPLDKFTLTQKISDDINTQGIKQITVDFVCQKNLALTTLKEFLEVFLSSIRNDQAFHFEIMS